ncbi:hypothetical protein ABR737_00935 [Streptomyces sp. Edi2]|uniref:hypothetical protein n=1 Tax=Streptomyces sp. Edi2 TaxID=3162528 RepID=UPI003305B721
MAQRAAFYPTQIAKQCELTPSRVSDVIAGRRKITQMSVIERIADGLGIPGKMLGLARRAWENADAGESRTRSRATTGGQPLVATPRQRPLLLPIEPAEGDDAVALRRELRAATSVKPAVARLFAVQVDAMRQLDRQLGAGTLLPQLEAQVQQMEQLLRFGSSPNVRTTLASTLTEASTLAAWQALDLGRFQRSWELHETAKNAARESASPALLAHATAQQAYILLDLGSPQAAIQQIRHARREAGTRLPPLMQAWLFAAEAEAHAAAQDESSCRRGMDQAEAIRPADPSDPALPFVFLGGSHLDRWRGNCLATLGADEALTDLTAAVDSMDLSGFTRAEAGVRCDLAVVLARRGELQEAHQQAQRAQDLAALTSSVRQRRRIAQVLAATSKAS